MNQCPCDGDSLLLPSGKLFGQRIEPVVQPDGAQRLVRELLLIPRRQTEDGHDEREILEDRHALDQLEVLEHHADLPAKMRQLLPPDGREVPARDDDLPLARLDLLEDQLEDGRLARTAGTGEEYELPLVDLERDVAQSGVVPIEALGDMVEVNHAGNHT